MLFEELTLAALLIAMNAQNSAVEIPQSTTPKTPKQEKVRATPSQQAHNRPKQKWQRRLQANRCQGSKKN